MRRVFGGFSLVAALGFAGCDTGPLPPAPTYEGSPLFTSGPDFLGVSSSSAHVPKNAVPDEFHARSER
jgi:hypothetical protein